MSKRDKKFDGNKSPDKKHPEPKIVPFESTQKCVLTDKELQVKGAELADAIDEGGRLEAEFSEVKQQFKGKIDGAVGRASGLSSTIRAKTEYRTVKCERTYDFKAGTITERRTDTGEIIGERLMSDMDRQQNLPLEDRQDCPAETFRGEVTVAHTIRSMTDEELIDAATLEKPENEFVASVAQQFEERGNITDAQREALQEIVDRA